MYFRVGEGSEKKGGEVKPDTAAHVDNESPYGITESLKDHEEASRETFMTACEEQQVLSLPHNQSNTSLN